LHDFTARTDLTFQEATGVTASDGAAEAVGLALSSDQMGDLSYAALMAGQPQLVVNPDFASGVSGWSFNAPVTMVSSGGGALIARNSGSPTQFPNQSILTNGDWYEFGIDITARSNSVSAYFGTPSAGTEIAFAGVVSGVKRIKRSEGATMYVGPTGVATAGTCTIDNVLIRRIPGNHAVQSGSTSFRPTRQADGSVKGDRLDDNLLSALLSSASSFKAAAMLASDIPSATAAIIGGPVSTTRDYLARDTSGRLCAGVGADGPATIVGGGDISGLKGVAMLNIDAVAGTVDLEWMPKGGDLVSLYSGPINGAVGVGTALRLFATNPSGTAGNFGGDSLYLAAASQAVLTPAERLAFATGFNSEIPA